MHVRELFVDGKFCHSQQRREVRSPFSHDVVGVACFADAALMERALADRLQDHDGHRRNLPFLSRTRDSRRSFGAETTASRHVLSLLRK